MGLSLYLFMLMHLLFLLFCFHLFILTNSSSSTQPLCHEDESSALWQFKQSFSISEHASDDPSAYPKVASWKLQGESNDCCLWDGVECDEGIGHVIGLDLSSSFLYGSINSNSTLFRLAHLQRLHLADNDFNYSQIPPVIGNLSELRSLNLFSSLFSGQIPLEISMLTQLTSLNLSFNPLKLQKPSLGALVENLTRISELSLSDVSISSEVPDVLANLPSLTSILLENCGMHGEFPIGIFHLPQLQVLSVWFNQNLTGYLPEFHQSSPLKMLKLAGTSFSGKLPSSIGNLSSLSYLNLSRCYFSGSLPASLSNLTQLTFLNLANNSFNGQIPSLASLSQLTSLSLSFNEFNQRTLPWIGELKKLSKLSLADINLYGEIPVSLANLTQLTMLNLHSNHLSGQIPSWLMNLTQLTVINLSYNQLQGPIPSSFSKLKNLRTLALQFNNFNGTVDMDIFLKLKNLSTLRLSYNNLSLHISNKSYSTNATLPKFEHLGLGSCNLREFPYFLRFQDELKYLFLAVNNIHGQIPEWMWNSSIETLGMITLSDNFLTSFGKLPGFLPWTNLGAFDVSFNMLQGSLPIPPRSTFSYRASNNRLTGEIPQLICQLSSLYDLDLSKNKLSGEIPVCFDNFSNSLSVLNLKGNNFSGTIPQTYSVSSKLRMIDLSQNHLQGPIPRSLENCAMLEILDLGNNQIEDTFPFWLGALSKLQVLILRGNKFHGAIWSPKTKLKLSNLRIIDLSDNGFTGDLPQEFFQNFNAMKFSKVDGVTYLQANISFQVQNFRVSGTYPYSMTMTYKGIKTVYEKILNIFTALDLSSNKFIGQIPEYIGEFKGLQLLNLSGNDLIGLVPSSFENLTNLESLDLSQNRLSGEIPLQLAQLTFLAFLNVSDNNLTGPIPRGKQFDTFENNSYKGNSGLCGEPLSKKCIILGESPSVPPSTSEEANDSEFPSEFDWIFIFAGYGSGLIVGLIIGHTLTTRYHDWFQNNWFVKTFGKKQQKPRRKRGQRN